MNHLAISGLPRSGTSWLAKALSLCRGVNYYFEPDSELPREYWYRYLDAGTSDSILLENIANSLAGRVRSDYVIAEQGLTDMLCAPFATTVLVKWVKFPMCLDWIHARFPELKVIQTVRHPIPLFLSWQQRDWDPAWSLKLILKQEQLMTGPLRDIAQLLNDADSFWQRATAFWAAIVTMQLKSHRPSWIIREHEWFCSEPAKNIRWAAEEVGLVWTVEAERFLAGEVRNITGPGYGRHRDPASEINKWQNEVDPSAYADVRGYLSQFNLPFYRELQVPDFAS